MDIWQFFSGLTGSKMPIVVYLSGYRGGLVLVPLQGLGREVGLRGLFHLGHGAVDVLVLEVLLEPIVFIPPDEEPDVFCSVQALE